MRAQDTALLVAALLCGASALQLVPVKKLCRTCKKEFDPLDKADVCLYHSGRYLGAERSKHFGKSGLEFRGVDYFWDCCDKLAPSDPGCCVGRHQSYDDDDSLINTFLLNNKQR